MAFRRRLGNLADTLLQQHLGRRAAEHQSGLVKQRQLELAEQRQAEIARQAEVNRQHEMLQKILSDPTGGVASALKRANIKVDGYDLNALMPTSEQITGQIGSSFSSKAEELPTDVGIQDLLRKSARPEMAQDPRYVAPLMTARDEKRGAILGGLQDTKRAEAVPQAIDFVQDGKKLTTYMDPFEAAQSVGVAGPFQAERTTAEEAARAGEIAGAEAAARQAAEWNPRVVAAKLDFEEQKHVLELAMLGKKAEAEIVAKRSASLKAALPQLETLFALGDEITKNHAPNVIADAFSAVGPVLGKVPWIGAFAQSAIETGQTHIEALTQRDPTLVQRTSDFLRLRGSTAMQLVNSIGGNVGQVSEADRRAMEELLGTPTMNKAQWESNKALLGQLITEAFSGKFSQPGDISKFIQTQGQFSGSAPQNVPPPEPIGPEATAPFVNQPFPANPATQTSPSIGPAGGNVPVPTLEEILRRPPRR